MKKPEHVKIIKIYYTHFSRPRFRPVYKNIGENKYVFGAGVFCAGRLVPDPFC
jgi:hypothetical protein